MIYLRFCLHYSITMGTVIPQGCQTESKGMVAKLVGQAYLSNRMLRGVNVWMNGYQLLRSDMHPCTSNSPSTYSDSSESPVKSMIILSEMLGLSSALASEVRSMTTGAAHVWSWKTLRVVTSPHLHLTKILMNSASESPAPSRQSSLRSKLPISRCLGRLRIGIEGSPGEIAVS